MVLTGPRQVGKTSLVRQIFPEADYVSLDVPSLDAQAEQNTAALLRGKSSPLIINEIHYAPSIFN